MNTHSHSQFLRTFGVMFLVVSLVGCSSNSKEETSVVAEAANSGMQPSTNGFTFANFGAAVTKEIFNTDDLVTMFGAEACVGGKQDPCSPTTQAAAWARMVNEARASGHCEGLAVQAAARFESKSTPVTKELQNAGDVTHGIMRAFATQFLPEVQDITNEWANKSLADIVNELTTTMKTGKVEYSLGLYTPTGGHAVLPYAVQFPSKDMAVVKVYDSNWPGQERYVVFDLAAKKWFFSFNGQDPQKDECAWTGKAGDIDLTPMSVRTSATCPFCGKNTTVTKSVLLIRSTGVEWEVKTKNGTFSPSNSTSVEGTTSRGLRSASCSKAVSLPEFILTTDSPDFELTLPETASAYISNGKSVVQIQTTGKRKRKPIKFTGTSVIADDPGIVVTVAANNLATQVTADSSIINYDSTSIVIDATVGSETKTITADVNNPQILITSEEGKVTTTTENVDLNKVEVVIAPELIPPVTKSGLPPADEREALGLVATTTTALATTTTTAVGPTTTLKKGATTTTIVKSANNSTATTPSSSSSSSSTPAQRSSDTPSASTSPAATTAPVTPTVAANNVTLKFIVVGTGWTPSVKISTGLTVNDQDYDNMDLVCSSNSTCQGATKVIPYGNHFFFDITSDQDQSYLGFGSGNGGTSLRGRLRAYRVCNSDYPGYASKTCEITLYKDSNSMFYG